MQLRYIVQLNVCLLFFSFSLIQTKSTAQQALYLSETKVFGGSSDENGNALTFSSDSTQLLLGGRSFSSDFFVPGNNGGTDYWLMKTTINGDTLWSRNYGGNNNDDLNALLTLPNGNIYGFGTSFSDLGELGNVEGLFGAWLMRTDTSGNINYGRMFSSNVGEKGIDLTTAGTGQFALLGETSSDMLEGSNNHGLTDFFVAKMTNEGLFVWLRTYGGSGVETPKAMDETPGAGTIVVGASNSNNGDVDTTYGGMDAWVANLDFNGTIIWSYNFGGTADDMANDVVTLPNNEGFLITGYTESSDNDVSRPNIGGKDLWLLRLDVDGNLMWEKSYGGSQNDAGNALTLLDDGTFVVAGETESNDVDLTGNNGDLDYWVIHFSADGQIITQMNYGGDSDDIPARIVSRGSEVYISGSSTSLNGNLPGQILPGQNMWLLTMSNDNVVCNENLICRQDTINDSNVIDLASNGIINCYVGCTVGLDAGPGYLNSQCPTSANETAIIMVNTDANAEFMTLTVQSEEFNTPYLVIAQSLNCVNYFPLECSFGANGFAIIDNLPVEPNTLYAVLISDLSGNVGEFQMCASAIDVDFCNRADTLYVTETSLGSPAEGPYLPGEEVTFCYELTDWEKLECNGLQGIVPTFGIGWDSTNFNQFEEPINIDTPLMSINDGFWDWYTLGEVNYNTFNPVTGVSGGQGLAPGWYFTNTGNPPPNSEPNETLGDNVLCTPTPNDSWKICFTLKTVSTCSEDVDCSVSIKTYADGEVGNQVSLACGYDAPLTFNASLNCCLNPNIDNIPNFTRCSGDTITFSLETNLIGDVNYSWEVVMADEGLLGPSAGNSQTFSQILENIETFPQSVTYRVFAGTEFCIADPEEFTITIRPQPRTTMSLIGPGSVCSGDEIELEFTSQGQRPFVVIVAANGSIQDTFLFENEVESIFIQPEINTVYAAVGLSDQNCIGNASGLVNVEVLPNPEVTLNEIICEGESFAIGDLQFSNPGQYSVTLPNASQNGCDSTVNLILGVAPTNESDLDTFICAGEVLQLGEFIFAKSGTFTVPLKNQFDCDSIVTLTLSIGNEDIVDMMQTICNGSSLIFNGQELSQTGIYTDTTFISEDCYVVEVLNLNVLPAIFVDNLTINPDNGQGTGAILIDIMGGTGPYTYLWSNGATTESVTDLIAGDYTVGVQDAAGCLAEFEFSVPLGTRTADQIKLDQQISVFPNPLKSRATLQVQLKNPWRGIPLDVRVIDLLGHEIASTQIMNGQQKIEIESHSWNPGVYLIRFEDEGVVISRKVIVQ